MEDTKTEWEKEIEKEKELRKEIDSLEAQLKEYLDDLKSKHPEVTEVMVAEDFQLGVGRHIWLKKSVDDPEFILSAIWFRITKHSWRTGGITSHAGSYGSDEGLIEIMGLLTSYEKDGGNDVVGHLTANNVMLRIRNYFFEKYDLKEE